jgi:hypothetical protein
MSEKAVIPATAAAAAIAVATTAALTVKNKKTLSPLGGPPAESAKITCPALFGVFLLLYFFIGPAYAFQRPVTSVTVLMLISLALFAVCYPVLIARTDKIK